MLSGCYSKNCPHQSKTKALFFSLPYSPALSIVKNWKLSPNITSKQCLFSRTRQGRPYIIIIVFNLQLDKQFIFLVIDSYNFLLWTFFMLISVDCFGQKTCRNCHGWWHNFSCVQGILQGMQEESLLVLFHIISI